MSLMRPALTVALLVATVAFSQDMQGMNDPLAGTTIEALGSYSPSKAAGQALVFLRITMEPGVVIPFHHHPGSVVVVVESGLFGTEFSEGTGTIARFGHEGSETIEAGSETTLAPGDSLAYEGAVHTMRNDGPEPVVLLVSALLDPEQPGFIFQGVP
ncbi:MAG TPA: hypothetical protein VF171_06475 [Trueperaceae bacterium]